MTIIYFHGCVVNPFFRKRTQAFGKAVSGSTVDPGLVEF